MEIPVTGDLRLMKSSDLEIVLSWRNHEDVRRFMFTQHTISLDEHQSWFAVNSSSSERKLLIYEYQGSPVGFVQFSGLNGDATADWGFYVAPSSPKGMGAKLGFCAMNYAFGSLGLNKVMAKVFTFNGPSIRFHEKLGFERAHGEKNPDESIIDFYLTRSKWSGFQSSL